MIWQASRSRQAEPGPMIWPASRSRSHCTRHEAPKNLEALMTNTATRIREITLVCVPTTDQDRAIEFYESLGFQKRVDTEFGGGYRWVEVYPPQGSTGIALAPPLDGQVTPTQTGITVATDDIDATYAELRALGVDVDDEVSRMGDPIPPMFWFRDPSGHTLMVVQQP
jgi:catechol 2,3-dioxygenase-like lactoylglutathione lyase family enzyme